jgi:hypothetical protein
MSDPTDQQVRLDAIIAQYRAELERLSYVRGSINVYLRSIRRLFQLMEEQGVALRMVTVPVERGAAIVRELAARGEGFAVTCMPVAGSGSTATTGPLVSPGAAPGSAYQAPGVGNVYH